MTYDQLQRLLNQRDGDLEQARNRLEQLERQLELAERNAFEEAQQKDEIIEGLQVCAARRRCCFASWVLSEVLTEESLLSLLRCIRQSLLAQPGALQGSQGGPRTSRGSSGR